jgi:WD40 repeat protein
MSSDEPYLWSHLAHHLRGAGQDGGPEAAELESLLRDPRWMSAQTLQLAGPTGHVLEGHGRRVRAVAVSPDASWLASADVLGTIRIWDMVDGGHRSTLVGHAGAVNALAVSRDSAWLASASADKTVRIWNVAAGTHRTLFGHADGVNAVAFSPDGTWLATAGMDGTVRLWNAANGSNLATAHGHSGPSRALAISPTDPLLVSTGDDWIMLRRTSDGAPLNNLGRWGGVMQWSVAFGPDGSWVACMGRGGTVLLLNVNGTVRATLTGHGGAVNAIAIAPDGTWLASAGADGTIRLWSAQDGAQRESLTGHEGPVNAVAVSPGGSWLASAGDDGTVRLWRVPPGVAAS